MAKVVGIDLGTANTLICTNTNGIMKEIIPTVVAITTADREVVALGKEAYRMLGKTPEGISAIHPLKGGVIEDPLITAQMIRALFERANAISFFSRPSVIICIPYGVNELEKRAVEEAAFEAGARAVALVDEPLAAALGSGIAVGSTKGSMIVDIGGGTTEIAVISFGGISASNSIRVAGDDFDDAIISYIRRKRHLIIGEVTAEELKIKIGSAHPAFDVGEYEISGRSTDNGLGAMIKVHSSEIREAISDNLDQIIRGIKKVLEQAPPELSVAIYEDGITLSGGGALLRGLARLIQERTGIKVKIAKHPLHNVCIGIMRIIQSEGNMETLLQYRGR